MQKLETLVLSDGSVTVRPFHLGTYDFRKVAKLANDYPRIGKYMGETFPEHFRRKEAMFLFKNSADMWKEKEFFQFAIYDENNHVGNIGFRYDKKNKVIKNLFYWIGKEFENKKIMKKALSLILRVCFRVLKVNFVYAGVYSGNIRSVKLLESKGFKPFEIIWRDHVAKDGEVLDKHCYSLSKVNYLLS